MWSAAFSPVQHTEGFIDWSISNVGIFDPTLWSVLFFVAPLPFSLVQHLPSPTFPVYRGVSSCVGLRDWPESESTKLLDQWPSQDKITGEEGGLSQIKSCRQVPFQVTFQMKTFCTAFWVFYFYEQDLRIWTHLVSYADIQDKQSSEVKSKVPDRGIKSTLA
jgi:hypothetical protein